MTSVHGDTLKRTTVLACIGVLLAPGATGTCDDPVVTLLPPTIEVLEEGSADLRSEVEMLFGDPHFARIWSRELYISFTAFAADGTSLLTVETG